MDRVHVCELFLTLFLSSNSPYKLCFFFFVKLPFDVTIIAWHAGVGWKVTGLLKWTACPQDNAICKYIWSKTGDCIATKIKASIILHVEMDFLEFKLFSINVAVQRLDTAQEIYYVSKGQLFLNGICCSTCISQCSTKLMSWLLILLPDHKKMVRENTHIIQRREIKLIFLKSRHTVVCRAAQENGARATEWVYWQEQQSRDFHASVAPWYLIQMAPNLLWS